MEVNSQKLSPKDAEKGTPKIEQNVAENNTKWILGKEAGRSIHEMLKDMLSKDMIIAFVERNPKCPPLKKAIVIPGVLNSPHNPDPFGMPFVRAYAKILGSDYGISPDEFLKFIDKLNVLGRGNLPMGYVGKVGDTVGRFGALDPSNITSLVGQCMSVAGTFGRAISAASKKISFLKTINEDLFNPKGLKVRIVKSKELKNALGLTRDASLCAPLKEDWTVPSKAQLKRGERATVKVAHRQILALREHVANIVLAGERSKLEGQGGTAASEVLYLTVSSEMQFEEWRGEALEKLVFANVTTDEKKKIKLLKQSVKKDKEVAAAEKSHWLLIENLHLELS